MEFYTKKKRTDGAEISHYHGKDENVISDGGSTLSICKDYTDNGARINIAFTMTYPYDEFTVFEMPVSCSKCPVGFHKDCGRNIPFNNEDYIKRPVTCKLKKVDLGDIKRVFETNIELCFY